MSLARNFATYGCWHNNTVYGSVEFLVFTVFRNKVLHFLSTPPLIMAFFAIFTHLSFHIDTISGKSLN
jgi:hypothetical protein